jgi:excinuclease ABC subunit B
MTESIRKATDETYRRREIQEQYNLDNNITPETIRKNIHDVLSSLVEHDYVTVPIEEDPLLMEIEPEELSAKIESLTQEMFEAARDLEFEKAAELRDRVKELERRRITFGVAI